MTTDLRDASDPRRRADRLQRTSGQARTEEGNHSD
jgi:hypothetical protein